MNEATFLDATTKVEILPTSEIFKRWLSPYTGPALKEILEGYAKLKIENSKLRDTLASRPQPHRDDIHA